MKISLGTALVLAMVGLQALLCSGQTGAAGQQKVAEGVFGTKQEICFGLKGAIYFLKAGTDRLPDVQQLRAVGSVYATELNVQRRSFDQGFPGVTDRFEWFALDYNGMFMIDKAGKYRIRVTSDDGSVVTIDRQVVVDNDGIHGARTKEGSVSLEKGTHTIRIQYFQGPRFEVALVLEIAGEGEEYRILSFQEMKAPCPKKGTLAVIAQEGVTGTASPAKTELILDASGSMRETKRTIGGRLKIDVAKDVMTQVIANLPEEAEVALRVYGHRIREGRPGACQDSELMVPFAKIDKARLLERVKAVRALGTTPIAYSLQQVPRDFAGATGEKMVILITDGKEECHGNPSEVVANLLAQGLKLRLNVVGFALADAATKTEMEKVASLTGGRFFDAQDSEGLRKAISQSLAAPFDVLDTAGTRVASGVTGQQPIEVPEGLYSVVIQAAGAPVTIQSVRLVQGKSTRVEFTKAGQKTVSRVVGP